MDTPIFTDKFCFDGTTKFEIKKQASAIDLLYKEDADYERLFETYRVEIDELQSKMYAHNRYGLLLIFQAMDAAGKDSTIKHVMSGVNAQGVKVFSYKRPSLNELQHDYMWRSLVNFPERGKIAIFNRSYYEEVLIVKVHPEIITDTQLMPNELTSDMNKVFKHRYTDIVNIEKYAHRNGIQIMKFFLNVSKKEQGERMIARIDTPSKNWKFEAADVAERDHWDKYMTAYEDCINQTATKHSPWYVVPADDKKNMRIIISNLFVEKLKSLNMEYPKLSKPQIEELASLKQKINNQNREK